MDKQQKLLPQRVTINHPVTVSDIVEGKAVIVNLNAGTYYSLNSTGTFIWSLLNRPISLDGIVGEVAAAFEGKRDEIRAAVLLLLEQLKNEQLIRGEGASAGDPSTPSLPLSESITIARIPAKRQLFETPVLEVYTDMKDFLQVDLSNEKEKQILSDGAQGTKVIGPKGDDSSD